MTSDQLVPSARLLVADLDGTVVFLIAAVDVDIPTNQKERKIVVIRSSCGLLHRHH